ncbi:transposase [Halomonas rhizosphaerae]|uniref:transposase n=1 Tax=Halomonas rhizosphaerae TaxID=3043296 RepID=UPI00398D305D
MGGELVEFGGEAGHVHLLFEIPPTVKLSDLVKNQKSVTARRMRRELAAEIGSPTSGIGLMP